jgi:formate dehydrogenase formation protein
VSRQNASVTERPARPPRAEPREIVELKQIKSGQPELASAVDMQVALVEMHRRVQSRVPLPWIQVDTAWLREQELAGRPLVRFRDIPLEWTDFRLTFRQTADILHRFDAIEQADYQKIVAIGRDGNTLEPIVTRWYDTTSGVNDRTAGDGRAGEQRPAAERLDPGAPASLEQVLVLALRPFLARCADALTERIDLSSWNHGHCPFCGWEPDFAVITPTAERRLICGRCTGQWAFPALTCPFCANDERRLITSFATRDGRYRVAACDVCRRYLKAYDARHATRPVMVSVDAIATLPLDAAAIQKGYLG